MNPQEPLLLRAARWLTFASAATVMLSIAVSQILLALALAALLASGEKLRLPRIKWALGAFLLGTLISLAFSEDPAAGLPQVRKIYVFLTLLAVYSAMRSLKMIRWLFLTWGGIGAITALRGVVQYVGKIREARELGQNAYLYYVGERITGFTSHWNTYSAELMFALIMLGAVLLFGRGERRRVWLWTMCGLLIALAMYLGQTRGVWIAAAAACLYLVWFWKRWMVALAPLVLVAVYFASPAEMRTRVNSIFQPSKADSNQFRIVTWRTGLEIIKRHPVLGLGPEGVKRDFEEYLPADVPRPLPTGWYGHLHNIYLHYAAERGIPTMLALVWMLIQIIVDFWRGLRALGSRLDERRYLLHGGIAVVLATMVEGVVELNLGDSEVLAMFLVVVAAGYVALDRSTGAELPAETGAKLP